MDGRKAERGSALYPSWVQLWDVAAGKYHCQRKTNGWHFLGEATPMFVRDCLPEPRVER